MLQEHFYLETQVTIAVPKGEDGEMELFVSTQNPTFTQVGQGFMYLIYLFATLLTYTLDDLCLLDAATENFPIPIFFQQCLP